MGGLGGLGGSRMTAKTSRDVKCAIICESILGDVDWSDFFSYFRFMRDSCVLSTLCCHMESKRGLALNDELLYRVWTLKASYVY